MRASVAWVFLGLGWMACVEQGREPPRTSSSLSLELPPNQAVVGDPRLTPAASCAEVEQYIEDAAVLQMRAELIEHREMTLHFGGCCEVIVDAGTGNGGGQGASGPAAYTGTNNQVAGIEEGDLVKTDGTRMFTVGGARVHLLSSWPAAQLAVASTIEPAAAPRELLLDAQNDQLAVFSTSSVGTFATVYDVSDLTAPKAVRQLELPGDYLTSRRIGDVVRVVLRAEVRPPSYPTFLNEKESDPDEVRRKYAELAASNEQLIRARTLGDWLPSSALALTSDCSAISLPNSPTRLGFFSIATFDLSSGAPVQLTSAVTRAETVYASPNALYVTQGHWKWSAPSAPESDHSYVHKFGLSDPTKTTWVASGGMTGVVLDQFSLDEHDGHLRVATTTTTGFVWTNHVRVLRQVGSRLEILGETAPLAPGERIYSARFAGEKGFVVTFRQVDPLFTLDLADPTAPVVLGELKIPGFSTYMQLIDPDTILAVGEDQGAVKVSLFDVSDLRAPTEKDSLVIGQWATDSVAVHDHRAFTWSPQKKLLALPFFEAGTSGPYNCSANHNDVRLFEVDPAVGITPAGELAMEDLLATDCSATLDYQSQWRLMERHQARRSIIADDFLYAVSGAAVRVANVGTPETPEATVRFP